MQICPDNVERVVTAACILHNLLLNTYPQCASQIADLEDPITHEFVDGSWRDDNDLLGLQPLAGNTSHKQAKINRNYLCKYYNSPVGRVPWQDKMV
jgi:hypothetical protein